MRFFAIIFVLSLLALETLSNDYCSPDLCPAGALHIDCENPGTFSDECPLNARLHPLTEVTKQLVLDMINTRRNIVAQGELSGFDTAAQMGTVTWNTDLQRLAELSTKRCTMVRDECRNTFTFKNVAQLVFQQTAVGMNINHRQHLIHMIQRYYQTYNDAGPAKMANFVRSEPDYSPFAILVNQQVTQVGCGTSTYRRNGQLFVTTICNFSSRNQVGKPVYVAGATASKCTTGTNAEFPGLCSTAENIDPNAAAA